jgi:hypothetical protein
MSSATGRVFVTKLLSDCLQGKFVASHVETLLLISGFQIVAQVPDGEELERRERVRQVGDCLL